MSRFSIPVKVLVLAVALFFSGCALRGESKSVDEIYTLAKHRYAAAKPADLDPALSEALSGIAVLLEEMADSEDGPGLAKNSKELADRLAALLPKATYTVRPAMAELVNQYHAEAGVAEFDKWRSPRVKLLASRTYTVLAGELETSKFRL